MTLPGGAAAKLGYRYEKWWTLSELVRMLRDGTDSLRIEPPGLDGVEFVVKSGGGQEYHQAKRSHPSGKWSVAMLASSGVLASIGKLLIGNRRRFAFVSGSDARQLADLCEGAIDAESFEEFTAQFLGTEQRANDHQRVMREWDCDGRVAWDVLRRIDVHTISERELQTKVRWGMSALFLGNIDDLCAQLSTIIEDAVHRTIEHDELLRQLESAGFLLRKVSSQHTARKAVIDATDRYLGGVRPHLIQGSLIPRDKTDEIVERLTGEHPTDCVLTGKAGAGKTGCVVEIVEKLRRKDVRVLAFRLDRHMSATSPADLGRRLALEESPTLVLSAATEVNEAPAVLIIDQLDAVSAMSGRDSQAFDVVEQLLTEAKIASIGTVVVCRVFDWRNDPRLRGLIRDDDRAVNVDELSRDEVQNVLAKAGLNASAFSTRQLDLLRLPQNLSLFFNANISPSTAFSSGSDLLRRYWDEKRMLVGERAGQGDDWIDVIGAMCQAMNEAQQLSVREEKLDAFSPSSLDQFVSEGVLTKDGPSYAFGHESFFDYCFARLFANKDTSLTTELKSSEQHLFRRSQVRQVLLYLREADFARYAQELEALVSDEDIRIHIKDLIFTLLATFDDPRDEEWNVWTACVAPQLSAIKQGSACQDRFAERIWQRIFYAKSWFKHFDGRRVIGGWLSGPEHDVDLAMNYLWAHQDNWPDEVAAYLEPFVDRGGDWSRRLRAIWSRPGSCRSRRHFDLFLRLLDNGEFDDDIGSALGEGMEMVYYELEHHQPSWIPEVLAHQIRRQIRQAQAVQADGSKVVWQLGAIRRTGGAPTAFQAAAKHDPRTFVSHVLPAVLDLADATAEAGSGPPSRDAIRPTLIEDGPSAEDTCFHALANAFGELACTGDDLHDWIRKLLNRRTYTANHLLLAVYRNGGHRYADEAALEFCNSPWRFDCGYWGSPYWSATETLKALVPHCKPANRAELETVVLAYADPYEMKPEGIRQRGWAAFNLLNAIPEELRSKEANRRFQELQRKFRQPATAPRSITVERVGSPIAPDAADRLSDDAWLSAMAAYPSEERRRETADDWPTRGGARELARVFGQAAQKEPERFSRLGLQLPATTNPVYFSELLSGLAETTLNDDTRIAVCRQVFEHAAVECGREIANLLAKANTPLPKHALDTLVWLAVKAEDLEDEEQWRRETDSGRFIFDGDPHFNGINTTRGRAALALGKLILKDDDYVSRLEPALRELAQVRSAAVGSCVAYTLRTVAYHKRELGVDLFLRMDFSEDRLLGSRHVYKFMRENVRHAFASMRNLIVRMVRCSHPDLGRAGAALACMAAFFNDEAEELVDECRQGDIPQRLGSADVAAANVDNPKFGQWCKGVLRSCFFDGDPEVQKVAASCFRHIPESHLATYEDLIEIFCNSPAYESDAFPLLDALRRARAPLPEMTSLACERLLVRTKNRGMETRLGSELVFRLYQQQPNDKWTARCLDLIDRVCVEAPEWARNGFDDFER